MCHQKAGSLWLHASHAKQERKVRVLFVFTVSVEELLTSSSKCWHELGPINIGFGTLIRVPVLIY